VHAQYAGFAPARPAGVKNAERSLTRRLCRVLDSHVTRADRTTFIVATAAVTPLVICALLTMFRGSFANTNAALILVLVVVAFAATGLRTAGVVAAASSALWFDFLLTEPYQQFTITDRDDVETMVLLLLVGIAVTEVALWGRRQQAQASLQEGFLGGIMSAASGAAGGTIPQDVLTAEVAARIADVLHLDSCRFDPGTSGGLPRLNRDGSVTWQGRVLDVERDGLPTNTRIALPVENGGASLGRFLLTAATGVRRPDLQQRLVVVALADQVGAALKTSAADITASPERGPHGTP
jgi:K+-sensing histidine kinase KdpD